MNTRWLPTRRELTLIPSILSAFLAAFVPLMFLLSIIMGLDQYNQHRQFLIALQSYGREVDAVISQIEPESGYGYIFLSCPGEPADYDFAFVRNLSLYPSDWLESLEPGQPMRIIYVVAQPNEYARQAVPSNLYLYIQRSPGFTPDILGLFAFFLLIAILKPHFMFLGIISLEELLDGAVSSRWLK
jgi:hypothetical protein